MPFHLRRAWIVDPPMMVGLMIRALRGVFSLSTMFTISTIKSSELTLADPVGAAAAASGRNQKMSPSFVTGFAGLFSSPADLPPLLGGSLALEFKPWITHLLNKRAVSERNVIIPAPSELDMVNSTGIHPVPKPL